MSQKYGQTTRLGGQKLGKELGIYGDIFGENGIYKGKSGTKLDKIGIQLDKIRDKCNEKWGNRT